jgi:hypothetical protein
MVPSRLIYFEDEEKSKPVDRLFKNVNKKSTITSDLSYAEKGLPDERKSKQVDRLLRNINELEFTNNIMKLLRDMILNFDKSSASESEIETIKVT